MMQEERKMKRYAALWVLLCSIVAVGGTGCAWLCGEDDDDYADTYRSSTTQQYDYQERGTPMK